MSDPPRVGVDSRGRLVAVNVFDYREALKDLPGARFLKRTAQHPPGWSFPATAGAAAALLTILADSGAQVSPRVLGLAREGATREVRRAAAADESAPLPVHPWRQWLTTAPWSHQARGIDFLIGSSAAAIGAGMGTGKSLMAIGAMNGVGIRRALLVAPVATFGVFPRELRLHSVVEWHVENGQRRTRKGSIKKLSLLDRWGAVQELYACGCGRPHLAIVGYEALAREPMASADLGTLGVELVVYDEVHRLRAAGGGASWTAKSWVNQVPRRWGLSGTLMPQGPWDVYGTYRALDPAVFGTSRTRFDAEYIVMGQTKDGRAFPKNVFAGKREEFSRRFHSIAYVPRVDLRLPPVTHKIESFELEPSARALYDGIRDAGVAEISAAIIAAGGDPGAPGDERTVTPANAGVELLRFAQVTGGSVVDDEGNAAVVSTAKADALAGVLERVGCRKDGVDGRSRPDPVVVFCRFRLDLVAVAGVCARAGLRYREVSGSRKDGLDDEARMHPECDVLGAQIAAGGIGVDFTRARICVYYSCGYELWLFQQSLKRVHRPGQTRQVLNVYLVANRTVDGDIYTALARRRDVVESCMWAYLRGEAERDSSELPEMEVAAGEVAGEPMALPEWMAAPVPRPVPDREAEARGAALEAMGLAGF